MVETVEPLTVLMTVHNGGRYLRMAIESILAQTYRTFCFLIVDDASTDDTRAIVASYGDPRIHLVSLDRNVGQTAALNVGLQYARSPWIARMDADDFSAPSRLELQMSAVETDHSLDCIGTFAWVFKEDPKVVEEVIEKPLQDAAIKRQLWHAVPLIHGTLVMRRSAMLEAGGYDERYRYSADWEFYGRFLARSCAANLPQGLLGIRRHATQGSFSKVSLDENIEIFSRALASHQGSCEEAVLRESLSFTYCMRAKYHGAEGRFRLMLRDMGYALRWSIATALKQAIAAALPRQARLALQARPAFVGVEKEPS